MELNQIMGKQRLINKSIQPMSTVQNVTPANFTIARQTPAYGAIVMGDYKGAARFLDLNKMVNLPLVWAEQQHILGILDGREEDYDLETLTVANAAAIGTGYSGTLTVPSGEVWYVNAVQVVLDTTASAHGLTANWHCSLWPDRAATPSTHGQPFYGTNLVQAAGGTTTTLAEFGPIATAWLITNKTVLLRLPAGAVITFAITTTTAIATAAVANTIILKGFRTEALVA